MFRYYEIDLVWCVSIKCELNGCQIVMIEVFVSQFVLINFYWSCC